MVDAIVISTDMVEPSLRTDMCREMSRLFFEPAALPGDRAPLALSLRWRLAGSTMVLASRHGAQQYRRDRRHLAAGLDQYFIRLLLDGQHEGAFGESVAVGATGDICVFDLSRPFQGRGGQGAVLSLMLPRAALDRATGGCDLHGLVLRKGAPVTQFLTDFMLSFARLSETADAGEALALEEEAIALIGACLSRHAPPPDGAHGQVLRHRLLAYIAANLAAPELGPSQLMRRFQVSRAHLYRMFAAEGGVARLVRDMRLDAAFRALAAPADRHCSVAELAHRFGFSSATQFHRAFRARFAMTPTEARHEAVPAPPGLGSAIAHWHAQCAPDARPARG